MLPKLSEAINVADNIIIARTNATTHTPIALVVELKSNACLTATVIEANCQNGTTS